MWVLLPSCRFLANLQLGESAHSLQRKAALTYLHWSVGGGFSVGPDVALTCQYMDNLLQMQLLKVRYFGFQAAVNIICEYVKYIRADVYCFLSSFCCWCMY